jgi:hypothetical protein
VTDAEREQIMTIVAQLRALPVKLNTTAQREAKVEMNRLLAELEGIVERG